MTHEGLQSARLAPVAFAAALIALCAVLAAISPASASSDDPPHPASADCKAVWNNSSAPSSCNRTPTVDTEPGNCVITGECRRARIYRAHEIPRDGCVARLHSNPGIYYHWCTSTVTFSLDDTTDLTNCDGTLRTGSTC